MHIVIDPEFQSLIPPLTGEEYSQLEQNILVDGCRDPLVVWGDVLVDGHNRFAICTKHGIVFNTVEKEFADRDEVMDWMDAQALGRRNLHPNNFTLIIGRRYNRQKKAQGGDRGNQYVAKDQIDTLPTADKLAAEYGVSPATVKRAGQVEEALHNGITELNSAVSSGKVSINAAADVATLPKQEQAEIVAKGEKEILLAAKNIRTKKLEAKRTERITNIVEISRGNQDLTSDRKFPVIYADPPWRYEHVETESRAIENQYPTMSLDEICEMPIDNIAHDDCILFMWATSPKLEEAMRVISAWGFTYRTCAVWDKEMIGMGYYFRQQHELLLVAAKGELPTPLPADRPSSVLREKRGVHSAKPEAMREYIEKMYPQLDKIELFCRTPKEGWNVWGNQSAVA